MADRLSYTSPVPCSSGMISRSWDILGPLLVRWGIPDMDHLTCRFSNQLDRFVIKTRDPWAMDALLTSWNQFNLICTFLLLPPSQLCRIDREDVPEILIALGIGTEGCGSQEYSWWVVLWPKASFLPKAVFSFYLKKDVLNSLCRALKHSREFSLLSLDVVHATSQLWSLLDNQIPFLSFLRVSVEDKLFLFPYLLGGLDKSSFMPIVWRIRLLLFLSRKILPDLSVPHGLFS